MTETAREYVDAVIVPRIKARTAWRMVGRHEARWLPYNIIIAAAAAWCMNWFLGVGWAIAGVASYLLGRAYLCASIWFQWRDEMPEPTNIRPGDAASAAALEREAAAWKEWKDGQATDIGGKHGH